MTTAYIPGMIPEFDKADRLKKAITVSGVPVGEMAETVRPATQLEAAPVLDPVPEPAKAPADKPKARQPKVEANIIAPVEYSPAY